METFINYKGGWISKNNPYKSHYLTKIEIDEIFKKGGMFIRNIYNFDCEVETSFWYVIKDSFGGMDELPTKVRNQVRKSQKTYEFKIVEKSDFLKIAYAIFSAAIENYEVRAENISEQDFVNTIQGQSEKAEYWVAYHKELGNPVAFSINLVDDDMCEYQTMKALPEFLRGSTYPYYGLIFEMNMHYLEICKLQFVNDGARSITEHSNIQSFLIEKFKFRKAYCNLQVEYVWWLKIMINMLFPFRRIIFLQKVKALLNQEAMRRGKL